MKLVIIVFVLVLVVATLLARFINYSAYLISSERNELMNEITTELLAKYSVDNAVKVNNSSSCKNGPARPKDESFYDGILREIKKANDPELPESKIMDIRSLVVASFVEDSDGK